MQTLDKIIKHASQIGSFMPSYWSVCSNSLSNDRTPEIAWGSMSKVV